MEFSHAETCALIDKLLIDMLDLMEQKVQCEMTIEMGTKDGQLCMAKARYIKGTNFVSHSQLPTENGNDVEPLKTVTNTFDNDMQVKQLQLNTHPIDKENNFFDPINWFGILVPQSLQQAKSKYQQTLEYVVECVNIKLKLHQTMINIKRLMNIKNVN